MPAQPREFNTSGPNWPEMHYTLPRTTLVASGLKLVEKNRYFAIWAPRQGGKSTYFELLSDKLRQEGYGVVQVNFESYRKAGHENPMLDMQREAKKHWGTDLPLTDMFSWKQTVSDHTKEKWVLIIDEIEGLNPELLPEFLHTIRSLYHSRRNHALKSVIIVGVSNLAGIMQDHTSPFNIADSFTVPYFTQSEVYELLGQHEAETAQLGQPQVFDSSIKEKVWHVTAGQPGLVNGIAQQLVARYPHEPILTLVHFREIEAWYVEQALEKNTANIVNKASQYRRLIEELIYLQAQVKFVVTDPAISFLYTQGVIDRDENGYVTLHVPLYKKRLELAFAVEVNGEKRHFFNSGFSRLQGFTPGNCLNWPAIIEAFQDYVKRRSFRYFRAKDAETGQYHTLKEAAVVYAFETFIQSLLLPVNGKSYLEAHAGLGNSDLIVTIEGQETVIETKIYTDSWYYDKGLAQLKHYAAGLQAIEAVYMVFIDNQIVVPDDIKAQNGQTQTLPDNHTPLTIYHIYYDTEKEF